MEWNDFIIFSLHRQRIYSIPSSPCNKNTKWNNSMKRPRAKGKAGNLGRPMGGDTASAGRWKRTGLLPWKARHPGPPCGGRSAAFFRCCGRCPSMIHHAVQGARRQRHGWPAGPKGVEEHAPAASSWNKNQAEFQNWTTWRLTNWKKNLCSSFTSSRFVPKFNQRLAKFLFVEMNSVLEHKRFRHGTYIAPNASVVCFGSNPTVVT